VPTEERQDDERDHDEDHVGFAEVRPHEPRRAHHLTNPCSGDHTGEHSEDEHVDQGHEPALRPEPRQRPLAVHCGEHRHHDRRKEHEETPEDHGVHDARQQALQELLLAEHDRRLVANATRDVVRPFERLRSADEAPEEERAPREQRPGDSERRRQHDRARDRGYDSRAFLSSAVIAGTTS
jgi:hypothetical protein